METFSALLALCAGNSPASGEFPAQRPVTRSFDVFFDLRLNKRLSKQSWGWWFQTQSRSLWRHCNEERACHWANYGAHNRPNTGFILSRYGMMTYNVACGCWYFGHINKTDVTFLLGMISLTSFFQAWCMTTKLEPYQYCVLYWFWRRCAIVIGMSELALGKSGKKPFTIKSKCDKYV